MTVADAPTITRPDVDTSEDSKEFVVLYESTDDPNHRTHVVRGYENGHIWRPGMSTKELLHIARMNGLEVVALCGHRWVPKHNPDTYAACEPCIKIAGEIFESPNSHD